MSAASKAVGAVFGSEISGPGDARRRRANGLPSRHGDNGRPAARPCSHPDRIPWLP
jgi:hypothetical protein